MLKTPAGHKITAHNAAWMLKHQTRVPDGCRIEQSCGNRFCCNPAHLDAVKIKGRAPTAVSGERNGNTKVTDLQVIEIREHYNLSGRTQAQLAKEYGISQGQVSRIVRGCNR